MNNSILEKEVFLKLFKNPFRFLKEGNKHGIKSIRRFFLIIILFGITNMLLFFFSIYRLFYTGFEYEKSIIVLFILSLAIGFIILAAFKAYNYVIIDILKVFYLQIKPLLKKTSSLLIDKSEYLLKNNTPKKELSKSIDIKNIFKSTFNKIPKFLSNTVISLLLKIPIIEMLLEVRELITDGNKIEANNQFFNKIDNFIVNSIFEGNNTLWVWWMLPLNIIGMAIIILSKIN